MSKLRPVGASRVDLAIPQLTPGVLHHGRRLRVGHFDGAAQLAVGSQRRADVAVGDFLSVKFAGRRSTAHHCQPVRGWRLFRSCRGRFRPAFRLRPSRLTTDCLSAIGWWRALRSLPALPVRCSMGFYPDTRLVLGLASGGRARRCLGRGTMPWSSPLPVHQVQPRMVGLRSLL